MTRLSLVQNLMKGEAFLMVSTTNPTSHSVPADPTSYSND